MEDHLLACTDERLSTQLGMEINGRSPFLWEWDGYRYLEHLAVTPKLRGQGYGSEMFVTFVTKNRPSSLKLIRS